MTDQITTKPFRSQAQWRMAFARDLPFARRWAHETPGGKGKRYQRLPVKVKAPNYGARAGQTIAGNLRRGASGQFESGGATAAPAKRKPPKVTRGRKPAKTPEQRAQETAARRTERQDAARRERIVQRDAVLASFNIDPGASEALVMLAGGEQPEPAAIARAGFVEAGLVEQARDGSYRMTAAGRQLLNAAARGDKGRAGEIISRSRDRQAAAADRQAARAKPKPAAAGGGGKPKKPPTVRRTPTRSSRAPQAARSGATPEAREEREPERSPHAALAQRLSDGEELSAEDAATLVRNGLARRNRDGSLSLTAMGQRAIRTKAYTPTRTTDAGHTGVMVALYPDQAAAKAIAGANGVTEPLERLHLTLCFLGDSTEQPLATNKEKVIAAVAQWAAEKGQPLKGVVNGLGRFFHSESDDTNAVYVSPDVPGLPELRQSLAEWIEASGLDYSQDHGFTPHITVAYVPPNAPTPPIRVETPIQFDRVTLAWGDEQYEFPLGATVKSFTVYKDARGKLRWVAYSSNAYRDRDEEIVSTKALTDDCARADAAGEYGPLRWWHVPGWELGDCDFNAMHGRVLVESGTFKSDAIGRAVAKAAPSLQLSIGFTHAPDEPDRQGVFHHIQRFERSLVPGGRAANPFTRLLVKETRMDIEKEAALKATLGADAAAQVLQGADAVQKDADDRQTAYKSDDDPWAAVLTTLKAAVATMVAPPVPAEPVAEAETTKDDGEGDIEVMAEEMAVEPVAEEPGDMTYDEFIDTIRSVVREELAAGMKAEIAPIMGALDIEKKVSSAVQSLMQPYQAQQATKDDELATLKATIAEQQQRLTELEGDMPAAFRPYTGFRASESPATVVTKEAAAQFGEPNASDPDPELSKITSFLFGASVPGQNGHAS